MRPRDCAAAIPGNEKAGTTDAIPEHSECEAIARCCIPAADRGCLSNSRNLHQSDPGVQKRTAPKKMSATERSG